VIGLLVTSGNALPALGAEFHDIPLWAVGRATAQRAKQVGFRTVASADGDAAALARVVAERVHPSQGRLLLVSGRGQGMPLAATLRTLGFRVTRRVAYATEPAEVLPDAALRTLRAGSVTHALFFSTETARVFHRLARRLELSPLLAACDALAISSRTEVALRGLPWRHILVAAAPDQDSLLALLP
jgi:uroporphyrinogen-III synthase